MAVVLALLMLWKSWQMLILLWCVCAAAWSDKYCNCVTMPCVCVWLCALGALESDWSSSSSLCLSSPYFLLVWSLSGVWRGIATTPQRQASKMWRERWSSKTNTTLTEKKRLKRGGGHAHKMDQSHTPIWKPDNHLCTMFTITQCFISRLDLRASQNVFQCVWVWSLCLCVFACVCMYKGCVGVFAY